MAKIKPLLPTLREKKRYIAFEIISKQPVKTFIEVAKAITSAILSLVGELGMARAGVITIANTYEANKQRGLIRVGHQHTNTLISALTLVQTIDNQPVIIRALGTSGVLNKAIKKYVL